MRPATGIIRSTASTEAPTPRLSTTRPPRRSCQHILSTAARGRGISVPVQSRSFSERTGKREAATTSACSSWQRAKAKIGSALGPVAISGLYPPSANSSGRMRRWASRIAMTASLKRPSRQSSSRSGIAVWRLRPNNSDSCSSSPLRAP